MALKTKVSLGKDFIVTLSDEIRSEIEISSKKWKINLRPEDQENILKRSLEQLKSKVNFCYSCSWDLEDEIEIDFSGSNGEYEIPSAQSESSEIMFIRGNSCWQVDGERREESTKISELDQILSADFITWVRTAAFYGVGSYKS